MKKVSQKREGGFTLIELMIVVVIIGILAAIAIPNFLKFQLKSKAAESAALGAIYQAGDAFSQKHRRYTGSAEFPRVVPNGLKATEAEMLTLTGNCGNDATVVATTNGFCRIGWKPTGALYGTYCINEGDARPAAPTAADTTTALACVAPANFILWDAAVAKPRFDIATGVAATAPDAGAGTTGVDVTYIARYDLDDNLVVSGYYATDEDKDIVNDPINGGEDVF